MANFLYRVGNRCALLLIAALMLLVMLVLAAPLAIGHYAVSVRDAWETTSKMVRERWGL